MTTQAIATIGPRDYTPEQVALIKSQIAPGVSDNELQLFIAVSKQLGLDPFKKQIYAIQRNTNIAKKGERDNWVQKMTIQVSVDGLLAIAERSQQFAGVTAPLFCGDDGVWRDVWLTGIPAAAKIGVMRRGWREPVYGIAVMREYAQDNSMWKSKPTHMLEKCALAKALRRAFPNEFGEVNDATDVSADYEAEYVDTETGEIAAPAEYPQPEGAILWNAETGETLLHESDVRIVEPPTTPVEAPAPPKPPADDWKTAAAACWAKVKAWAAEHDTDPARLRYYVATDKGVPEKLTESAFKAWLDAAPDRDFDQLYVLYAAGERNAAQAVTDLTAAAVLDA